MNFYRNDLTLVVASQILSFVGRVPLRSYLIGLRCSFLGISAAPIGSTRPVVAQKSSIINVMTGARLKRKVSTSAERGPRKKVAFENRVVSVKKSQFKSSRSKRQHTTPISKKLPITASLEAQRAHDESSSSGEDGFQIEPAEDAEDDMTIATYNTIEADSVPVQKGSTCRKSLLNNF